MLDPYPTLCTVSAIYNCTTEVAAADLMVLCEFLSDSVLGYYVLVQFAEDLSMLLTGETQDSSQVEIDLPSNGLYNVVVFPLTENGIVGTAVTYTEEVTVTTVPDITTSTTTTPRGTTAIITTSKFRQMGPAK